MVRIDGSSALGVSKNARFKTATSNSSAWHRFLASACLVTLWKIWLKLWLKPDPLSRHDRAKAGRFLSPADSMNAETIHVRTDKFDPSDSADPGIAAPGRLRTTFRALQHRNFQLFFGGQLISLTGTWMQTIAQSVAGLPHHRVIAAIGQGWFFGAVPVFMLAPLGGMLADRIDRRRVVIGTQVSSMILAFVLAALTLSHSVRVWHLFVLSALLGVVNAFDIPARQSFLRRYVGREDLMNAIALNSSMFNGARIVGPAWRAW